VAFVTPLDIANRALQHVSQTFITTFQDLSQAARNINTAYDNLRLAELSRHTWAFSIRRARCRAITLTTQLWTPPTYVPASAYTVGDVVMYAGGTYSSAVNYPWILQAPTATGLQPDISPQWQHYFGPLTCDIFDSGQTYAAGELAIVPPLYEYGTIYAANNIVIDSSNNIWVSLVNGNVDNTPATSPNEWTPWVLPSSGQPGTVPSKVPEITFFSPPSIFLSLSNNNGPVSPAVNVTTFPAASLLWALVGGTVQQLTILYPLNVGPSSDSTTANYYRLPFGWLRPSLIPLNNKRTKYAWLGARVGPSETNEDFTYQGDYFNASGALWNQSPNVHGAYRDLDFIADVADVTEMPPAFCETLAIRIARDIDGVLTEGKNTQKLNMLYKMVTGEAIRTDMILQGDPQEELDELIRVRI
jgi:hypothetical protein